MQFEITVHKLIAHQVPRPMAGEQVPEPDLSEAVPTLPQQTLSFFGRRLIRTLQDRGQPVEVDPQLDKPRLPEILRDVLSNPTSDLVEPSQRAARYLLEVQPGSVHESQSLFVAADVTANGQRHLAVMKLEREEGVHIRQQNVNGKQVLTVEVIEDLMLTDNTRVFKAGLFYLANGHLKGYVSDDQQGARDDPARYFLQRFLGCRLERRPAIVTRDFFNAATDYFSKEVGDSERKYQYLSALQTEMASNRSQVDPVQFISDHLKGEDRAKFEKHIQEAGVPMAAFDKDLEKLHPRVARTRLKTSGGIIISGESKAMKDRIEVRQVDQVPAIVIKDTVTEV